MLVLMSWVTTYNSIAKTVLNLNHTEVSCRLQEAMNVMIEDTE